jgi:hypothetical protein
MTIQEKLPTVWVSLDVMDGGVDPDIITKRLGVEPTTYHRMGEARYKGRGRHTNDRWRVTVGPRETLEIGPMLSELLVRFAPGENALAPLCAELEATAIIKFTVLPGDTTPWITFSPDLLRWAGERNITIDIDVMAERHRDEAGSED